MELREYWLILYRRWWIPVGLTILVALLSAIQLQPWKAAPPAYTASVRMLVGVMPATDADATAYDPRYYAWLTSEYLVDDFTEVVTSELFSKGVSQRLTQQNIDVPPGTIRGAAVTGKQHRIITLTMNWGDADQLAQIATAAAAELEENASQYFQQLGTNGAGITILDGPTVTPVGAGLRDRLEFPLRVVLAFLIGVGIVFLMDYLDTSVRSKDDLEALGLTVIGTIPKK
jgi:capsular polysaccharide biosynthesis protein